MRTLSKPSTAKCTLEHYTALLLAEPQRAGCVRLAEVAGGAFAHDAANRFLNREVYFPQYDGHAILGFLGCFWGKA